LINFHSQLKRTRVTVFVFLISICIPVMSQGKLEGLTHLNSVSNLWNRFLKDRNMDNFQKIYFHCAAIFLNESTSNVEQVKKYENQFEFKKTLFLVIDNFKTNQPALNYDEVVSNLSDHVEQLGDSYKEHGFSLMPPKSIMNDRDRCISENCLLKFTQFLDYLGEEASDCIRVLRWSENS